MFNAFYRNKRYVDFVSLIIFYTPRAKETLKSVYGFIDINFGHPSAEKFLLKVDRTVKLISQNPLMFKSSSIDENVRVGLISKQTSLFYRFTDSSIQLLFFWDNRQEPFDS
ncbi:MAG: type II toxin-antitoxin system RelE/ParE family toxin [Sphingobacteriaceae bacterium]|nr:MAG: type II toxin-antitoxin system RelE/ParE family toxin [Sphingobacteriaceae bacterium]